MKDLIYIIKGCIEKKDQYQRLIYDHYRGFALKIVFRYIYRYDKAIRVVNDGFVKLFRNFEKFQLDDEGNSEKALMSWLKRILINTAIDELRKAKMVPEIGGIPEDVWDIKDNNQDADQLLMYKDLIILVKQLPPQYRAVFNLYVIDGYTHTEIADIMNIPIGTSKSSLSRARLLLQNSIKKMEEGQLCRS